MEAAGILDGLNEAQRAAAEAVRGPLCILAGAGTGKTRTITHRIAHQVASGTARADQILAVTFTDKAATELRSRLAGLGIGAPIRAATFHAAAWAQLLWFRSCVSEEPLPDVLTSKVRPLLQLARRTSTQAQDLAAEIEWAKARRLTPEDYAAAARHRDAPLEATVMAEVYAEYERTKSRSQMIDYEDMLLRTADALETDDAIAGEVRDRYRYFTVDEFQDVNPAQFALLRAWLGDRDDLCVVGDDDQTIYSFTGATSTYLTGFTRHFPGARRVTLTENYRSTPEVLALANRVLWTKPAALRKRLRATSTSGPVPLFREFADDEAEVRDVAASIRALVDGGVPAGEIAVLYRINSQSEPLEEALAAAGVPYVVRGAGGFFTRREVRQALLVLRSAPPPADAPLGLEDTVRAKAVRADEQARDLLRRQMGHDDDDEPRGANARERWRNVVTLNEIATRIVDSDPTMTIADLVAELERRAAGTGEQAGDSGAVTLSTLHRAKGLEFDAVFLVAVEEGLLPISHAKSDDEVEEERRLLYVGVTRARRHLQISWAAERPGYGGRIGSRRPSRLLYNLGDGAPASGGKPAKGVTGKTAKQSVTASLAGADADIAERLRSWRKERAVDDAVPAFVVFNDRTLVELARRRPSTTRELLAVPGIGQAKADRYGADLLQLLTDVGS